MNRLSLFSLGLATLSLVALPACNDDKPAEYPQQQYPQQQQQYPPQYPQQQQQYPPQQPYPQQYPGQQQPYPQQQQYPQPYPQQPAPYPQQPAPYPQPTATAPAPAPATGDTATSLPGVMKRPNGTCYITPPGLDGQPGAPIDVMCPPGS